VFNPGEHPGRDIGASLAIDLAWICLIAECLVVLPEWENSKGAVAEYRAAEAIGLPVHRYNDDILVKLVKVYGRSG
jgi:hypothetical protein